jgi:hypothetical protein
MPDEPDRPAPHPGARGDRGTGPLPPQPRPPRGEGPTEPLDPAAPAEPLSPPTATAGTPAPPWPPLSAEPSPDDESAAEAARREGREVADTARDEGQAVAERALHEAQGVAESARAQGAHVIREAADQTRNLVEDTTAQLHDQAREQTDRLAGTLQRLGAQMQALADGRSDDAGQVEAYVRQAANSVSRAADRVESLGFDGVVGEVTRFARRRPGAFLAGAAIAGFAVGRVVRNTGNGGGSASAGPTDHQLPAAKPVPPSGVPPASGAAGGMR